MAEVAPALRLQATSCRATVRVLHVVAFDRRAEFSWRYAGLGCLKIVIHADKLFERFFFAVSKRGSRDASSSAAAGACGS